MGACQECGFCDRTACEANAKASSVTTIMPALRQEPKFELRTRAFASKLLYDKAAKRVTGVLYTDLKTGAEYEQPANLVILSAFVFGNTHMLLHSGIGQPYDHQTGKGLVGKELLLSVRSGRRGPVPRQGTQSLYGLAGRRPCDRRFQRPQFRSCRAGLFRRRLFHRQQRRQPADRRALCAAGHTGLGQPMEARNRQVVRPRDPLQHPGLGLRAPRQLYGHRSGL